MNRLIANVQPAEYAVARPRIVVEAAPDSSAHISHGVTAAVPFCAIPAASSSQPSRLSGR
jgi:hypothetical protein